jgi:uncharacterized protein with ParB-like and HNH nuclease domain
MLSSSVNLNTLFAPDIQYRIPLYQRRYVWSGVEWKHLWEDIIEISTVNQDHSQHNRKQHFTGTIVTRHETRPVGVIPRYEIIDGQQRLLTFQIILCVLRDICEIEAFSDLTLEANRYLLNTQIFAKSPDDAYKLSPSNSTDRHTFISFINGSETDGKGQIHDAYFYFDHQIVNYVRNDREKILVLFYAILQDFAFIQIQVENTDEPGQIYESLNATGRKLSDFELLKNDLFLKAGPMGNQVLQEYWQHFEEDSLWTSETVDKFFVDFLIAKLGPESIGQNTVFDTYKRFYRLTINSDMEIEHVFSELKRYSNLYQMMNDSGSRIGARMQVFVTNGVVGLSPFIMFIKNELNVSDTILDRIFDVLESYIIRCLLCIDGKKVNLVKSINMLFSEIINKTTDFSLNFLVEYLSDHSLPNSWPTDQNVKSTLKEAGVKNSQLISYILYRIELVKRKNLPISNNVVPLLDQLALERVMPINWNIVWPSPPDTVDIAKIQKERNKIVQNIGNLTLATHELSMEMKNQSFSEKKEILFKSDLFLNREIHKFDTWDVQQIREREDDLFKCFCSIWQSAEEFL